MKPSERLQETIDLLGLQGLAEVDVDMLIESLQKTRDMTAELEQEHVSRLQVIDPLLDHEGNIKSVVITGRQMTYGNKDWRDKQVAIAQAALQEIVEFVAPTKRAKLKRALSKLNLFFDRVGKVPLAARTKEDLKFFIKTAKDYQARCRQKAIWKSESASKNFSQLQSDFEKNGIIGRGLCSSVIECFQIAGELETCDFFISLLEDILKEQG